VLFFCGAPLRDPKHSMTHTHLIRGLLKNQNII
jgi:hypothetical protein